MYLRGCISHRATFGSTTGVIGVAFWACAASAQQGNENFRQKAIETKLTAGYQKCLEKNATTVGIVECTVAELEVHDARLNKAYKALISGFGTEDAKRSTALRAAQRLWIQYRDANCTFEGSEYEGGTMRPVVELGCKLNMTVERANELEDALNSPK